MQDRKLIGFKIGDKFYHPSDVEIVYECNHDAESEPHAAPGGSSEEATEREYFERRCREWKDQGLDGVLRDPGAVDSPVRNHDSQEA